MHTEIILETINDKKTNISPGPDDIYPQTLKEYKIFFNILTYLFNKFLQQSSIPINFKTADFT